MTPSPEKHELRLAELLGVLSQALDLTEGQPKGHCLRCCWIGMQIGARLGLTKLELSDLYYTLLLKDLGCSSNAARICQLYLTDDHSFKSDFKFIDGSLSQALRFVLGHTGLKAGLADRFYAIINILQNGGRIARELIEARCHRGADIAGAMRFSPAVCDGIRNLDEHWDGSGLPLGLKGQEIPLYSRIALLAQVVEVFHTGSGASAALREAGNRRGSWFDPALTLAFENAAASPEFWKTLRSADLGQSVISLEPAQEIRLADEDYLDEIAAAFAQVIDAKSPFTSGHSGRVAVFTDLIAAELGLFAAARRRLRRAALLHDIGKLGISNSILDKPGKLTAEEFAAIKLHPVYSESILAGISVFADLVPVAGGHHERLDGKGYPRGLKDPEIGLETRIVTTADIFDALTADRPYRAAMPISRALSIMAKDVGPAIDPGCFAALQGALRRAEAASAA